MFDIRVYFRFRSGQANRPGTKQLYIRLSVDGETATNDYGSGVYVRPSLWDQSEQLCRGRSAEAAAANELLSEVTMQHLEILRDLKKRFARGEGPRPTADLVKAEFMEPGASNPDLITFYAQYMKYLDSLDNTEGRLAGKTKDRIRTGQKYLSDFVAHYCQQQKHKGRFTLLDVNTAFGKQYHAFLQVDGAGRRRMKKDSANKYLSVLRDCLEYAIDSNLLAVNPLDRYRPKRGKNKTIYFLDDVHIDRFFALRYDDETMQRVLWWSALMMYTGMDYVDAVRYCQNRLEFERETDAGVIIHIQRTKPPRNWCEIPQHPVVHVLLSQYPEGPKSPNLADMNRHLKVIQAAIGFHGIDAEGKPYKLTTKILRKTAGAVFLRKGYQIAFVSKLLGHSSIRTTEEHYVNVKALSMQAEIKRVQSLETAG